MIYYYWCEEKRIFILWPPKKPDISHFPMVMMQMSYEIAFPRFKLVFSLFLGLEFEYSRHCFMFFFSSGSKILFFSSKICESFICNNNKCQHDYFHVFLQKKNSCLFVCFVFVWHGTGYYSPVIKFSPKTFFYDRLILARNLQRNFNLIYDDDNNKTIFMIKLNNQTRIYKTWCYLLEYFEYLNN